MSLHQIAKHVQAQGRGNDTQLMHVTPSELNTLQSVAKAHGGSLTINPSTGLPEAGFLDAILPAVAGAGLSLIPGVGPLMAAGIVGAGTGLLTKDLNKGLMAGLGAFGGASLAGGLIGAGTAAGVGAEGAAAALGTDAATGLGASAAPGSQAAMLAEQTAPFGAEGIESIRSAANTATGVTPTTAPTAFDQLKSGFSNTKFDTEFLKKNMFPLGAIAAPMLMGGSGSLFGGSQQAPSSAPGYIRPYTYSQVRNPYYGQPGQPYFTQTMTPGTPVAASDWGATTMADGGIVGLADGGISAYSALGLGGPQDYRVPEMIPVQTNTYAPNIRPVAPEVAAFNQQMMQRANQQYNLNPRPLALQVPGMDRPVNQADPGYVKPADTAATTPQVKPADWIDDYYQQMLGRNADPTGRKLIEDAMGKSWYDPARDVPDVIRQSEEFKRSGKNPNPTGIEIGKVYKSGISTGQEGLGGFGYDPKTGRYSGNATSPTAAKEKTEVEKMREELDALKSEKAQYQSSGNYGNAAGGLMGYAMGGDIGARYQSPDDGGLQDRSNVIGASNLVNMAPHYPMQGLYQGYAEGGGITNTKMAAVQQYSALAASGPDGMKQVMAKAKAGDYNAMTALNNMQGTPNQNYAAGGASHLGDYSDGGRLLKGPGDGVSDDIPAQIGARQPARLADGEFVVPARIVSELGNGSTEAGAKRLYAMMDRVQKDRKKSVGKNKVAVDSKSYKHLPA